MSGYLRRLATTGAAYTAASILSKVIAVALLPLYTSYLTPADYGAAEVMFAAIVAVSIFVRFGLIEAVLRFYYKDDEDPARVVASSFAGLFWFSTLAALLEPEQGEQELEHRQHPEAGDRDPGQLGRGAVEQRFGDRPGEGQRDQRRGGAEPEERGEGGGDDTRRVLAGLVVEAQHGLDHAEADDDAAGDDRGEEDLGDAVVGGREEARVERQQRDRDQLRDDARRGVGGAGRR